VKKDASVKQMLAQEDRRKHRQHHVGGWWITRSRNQLRGSDDHKAASRPRRGSLAMEYVKQGIRVNAVAPGVVDTPCTTITQRIFSRRCSRWEGISEVKDIVDAIVSLTEAGQVTGEVLHVDGRCARRQMVTREGSRPPAPSSG